MMRSHGREVLFRKHFIFILLTFSFASNTPPAAVYLRVYVYIERIETATLYLCHSESSTHESYARVALMSVCILFFEQRFSIRIQRTAACEVIRCVILLNFKNFFYVHAYIRAQLMSALLHKTTLRCTLRCVSFLPIAHTHAQHSYIYIYVYNTYTRSVICFFLFFTLCVGTFVPNPF